MELLPTRQEAKDLADYMEKVVDSIPSGLSNLKNAASFALFEIKCNVVKGIKTSTYAKALAFGQSIPRVLDVKDDALISWMLNDQE